MSIDPADTPPGGYEYATLAGDVCSTCGCVVADVKVHNPCPAVRAKSLNKRLSALEAKK